MKGKFIAFASLALATLTGCGPKVAIIVEDMTMTVGERQEVAYTLDPTGYFATASLEVVTSTPADIIEIEELFITAKGVGTASLKLTATNMPGASEEFSASKPLTVTVEEIELPEGEFIYNGGLEYGLEAWTFDPNLPYATDVIDNLPHDGDYALNLWYDEDLDEVSDDMDLLISQEAASVATGTYLFSLWYQGTADSITMSVTSPVRTISAETFSGFDYKPVPDHDGYVQLGIEAIVEADTSLVFSINVLGATGFWGYIDDVSFKLGTLDDLELAPPNAESGYVNHIVNGTFVDNSTWTVELTGTAASKEANFNNGRLRIWTSGIATLKVYQSIEVTAETYSMCIYLNGGVFGTNDYTADASYAYVEQGETLHTLDIEPVGWNDGVFTRIEKSGMSLSGTIEVGIYINFTGGSNNWVDLDDFALWSYNIPS